MCCATALQYSHPKKHTLFFLKCVMQLQWRTLFSSEIHYFPQKFVVVIHFPMFGHCKFLTYYPNISQHCMQHLPFVSIQKRSLQPLQLAVAACVNLCGLWTKTLCMCLMIPSYTYKCPTSFMCTKLLVCQN